MKKLLAFSMALLMFSGATYARKVSGTVMSGEEKLSGVIVTDGKNFTQTRNGNFRFEVQDNAEFIYIVTPSGYVADWSTGVPAFYQSAEGKNKFHFELQKTDPADEYSIVAVADPQMHNEKHLEQFSGAPMQDLCETISGMDRLTVGLALGDICWDSFEYLEKYRKEIVRTGIPFYPVVGNHDHDMTAKDDLAATAAYRKIMGPENYAFFIGKDIVIVLDNILNNNMYQEGYAPYVLSWVKGLVSLIPESSDIYIAQHSPVLLRDSGNRRAVNSRDLIGLVHGHEVHFISGHTHINNNFDYGNGVYEHNVAALCGSWWDTAICTDGTPGGYKVFTKKNNRLSWYYKSVGHRKDHQMEMYGIGQSHLHPNSVVLNVWDWDPDWKVEWYQDGVAMGELKPIECLSPKYIDAINAVYTDKGKEIPGYKVPRKNNHYFAATPSQYARKVIMTVESRFGEVWVQEYDMGGYVDVQAHRGGAGLKPENTIEAMKNALDLGVNTLEMDLQVTADGQVVVSHDKYIKGDTDKYIYTMTYNEIAECSDIPLASDLIDFVENYTRENGLSPVRYNIEIKSEKRNGEGIYWPVYDFFVRSCALLLHSKNLGDRLVVQSFDTRALEYMRQRYPEFILSYLVSVDDLEFDSFMSRLKFTPDWLSPHFSMTDEELVRKCREKGMKIVPWTVDEPEDIKRMLDLKVDAIISNYPDRVLKQTRAN